MHKQAINHKQAIIGGGYLFTENACFIFAAVTIFVYRYDRITVSIRIGCPLYRYCIDTDCIVPALLSIWPVLFRLTQCLSCMILTAYSSWWQLAFTEREPRDGPGLCPDVPGGLHPAAVHGVRPWPVPSWGGHTQPNVRDWNVTYTFVGFVNQQNDSLFLDSYEIGLFFTTIFFLFTSD